MGVLELGQAILGVGSWGAGIWDVEQVECSGEKTGVGAGEVSGPGPGVGH